MIWRRWSSLASFMTYGLRHAASQSQYHLSHDAHVRERMTPAQLRIVVAVSDLRSFTAAATKLGVAQPSISRAIALVERELDAQLFVRSSQGAVATQAGVIAVRHARAALGHLDRLREEIALLKGSVIGSLRIASLPSTTGSLLAVPLREFRDRHPAVDVSLFEGTDAEVRQWLVNDAADLGVVTHPMPGMQSVALGEDELIALVPAKHRLAAQGPIELRALQGENFIYPTGGCGDLILEAAKRANVSLSITLEAREPQSLVQMVRAGLGVTVMPTLNLPADPHPAVVLPLSPRLGRSLHLALAHPVGAAAIAFCSLLESADD